MPSMNKEELKKKMNKIKESLKTETVSKEIAVEIIESYDYLWEVLETLFKRNEYNEKFLKNIQK